MPSASPAERFDQLLGTGFESQLREVRDKELRRLEPAERAKVQDELARNKLHDELITVVASAFAPPGDLRSETGYEFVTSEPLVELKAEGCKSFDVLLANREQGVGVFVECKTSIADPSNEITDLADTIKDVEDHLNHLQDKTGTKLSRREYVFCVPSSEFDGLARAIVDKEEAGLIDPKVHPVKIWHINRFGPGPGRLSLLTQMRRREDRYCQHLDAKLTRHLAAGAAVMGEVLFKCYPSSHPLVRANAALVFIQRRRGENLSQFTAIELTEALSDFAVVPHYDIRNLGPVIATELAGQLSSIGVLSEDPPGTYALNVRGKGIATVLKQLESAYVAAKARKSADDKAKELALEKVLKRYPKFE